MRQRVRLGLALLVALGACGKEEEHGPDVRKTPPVPPKVEPAKPSPPAPGTAATPGPGAKPPAGAPPAAAPAAGPAAIEVKVAPPIQKTVRVTADYTGQTIGSETIEVRARVEGFLESIHFTEGTFIKQGDLLYQIDKEKMEQVVEQAEGVLNVAKANEEKSIADVNRYRPLLEKNAISREEYETSVYAQKAAHAQVEAAAAAVQRAKINLGYATVRAPAPGLVGKTEVDVGNLVGRGEPTLLTTISDLDPIYAEVRVSETDMLEYRRTRPSEGRKKEDLDLTLFFSDGSQHPHKGEIAVIDRNVDEKTGTILVQVSFPNPELAVRPGQFARVQAVKQTLPNALLVPQGAVEELQGTYKVYVVGAGDVVKGRMIKVGPRQGPLWVISQGLQPGEQVVIEGRQKVRDGVTVKPLRHTIGDDGGLVPAGGASPPAGAPAAGGSR